MNTALDERLLTDFIATFYGYGNYAGNYRFIGMEEGGGSSLEEIQRRITTWAQRGKCELEDVAAYHLALGFDRLFTEPVKLQNTWNKLIRVVLSAQGINVTKDTVRDYQREQLGRPDGDTCLVELLPLPSPSTNTWLYEVCTTIPGLHTRKAYRAHYAERRTAHLRQRIEEHRPPYVVFYGFGYLDRWHDIARVELSEQVAEERAFYAGANANTRFFVVTHPMSAGVTNAYFHHVGALMQA